MSFTIETTPDLSAVDRTDTVLHVDDDPAVLDLTESFLTRELDSVRVISETEVTAGIEHLGTSGQQVDCIISDYQMPGKNGLEFLRAVHDQYPSLPFILYTGQGSETVASKAIDAGVTDYLQKGGVDQQRRLANRVDHAISETRARRTITQYARVLKALDYPIYQTNADGKFEYVNQAFADLTGYSRETLVGSRPDLIKDADARETVKNALRSILSEEGPDTGQADIDIMTSDGSRTPVQDHIAALTTNGEYDGAIGILRDMSACQKYRSERDRQHNRLKEVLSVISHDIRTPLQAAHGAVERARDRGREEDFDRLERAINRTERLVDEVLTLANHGERVEETNRVNAAELARQCWNRLESEAATLEIAEEVVINANSDRLRHLLQNLLANALRHGETDVTVRLGRLNDRQGFYVADDGPGIPKDIREDVFDPGYTTADAGTGFGLSIVKQAVAAHGWDITVTESRANGARFEITGVDTRS